MASSAYEPGLATRQPFKALYVLLAIAIGALKLPFWLVYFIPSPLRQHPSYSYRHAVRTELLRTWLGTVSTIRIITPLVLEPGPLVKDRTRFVQFNPSTEKTSTAERSRYTGIVSISPHIRPAASFGIWYPETPSADLLSRLRQDTKAPKLVLHFHGGAFALGNPRPDYSGYMGNLISKKFGPTLCASYRLASNPSGAFPAALQDAITAYSYVLTELRIPARQVIFSGDSAGANIAVALLRYIIHYPEAGLELPSATTLWSPWVDVSAALKPDRLSESPNAKSDYITPSFAFWGASSVVPKAEPTKEPSKDTAADGVWLSPLNHPFHVKTPIWMLAGGTEILLPDIVAFAQAMQKIRGNNVEVHVEPVGHHDIVLVAPYSGFYSEAEHAVDVAHRWLKRVSGA